MLTTALHPIELMTVLGPGALQFVAMSAREELGRPFEFDVDALSENAGLEPKDLLGTAASVVLHRPDGAKRHFHGIVCAMGMGGVAEERRYRYRLVLRPWFWLATLRADTRIFQGKTVVEVLKAVLQPYRPQLKFELRGNYPPMDYCVQYRETDFNFASRLMEQEGIYYYFQHDADGHMMVVVDAPTSHRPCPGEHRYGYHESVDAMTDIEAITSWQGGHHLQPGKVVHSDYNFTTPAASLRSEAASPIATSRPEYETYDYPGEFQTLAEGKRYALLRQQEHDARVSEVEGGGAVGDLAVGFTFTLTHHPQPTQMGEWLVVSTRIDLLLGGRQAGDAAPELRCRFTAMPAKETFRSERLTPKPVVHGLHSAVVVGPPGEEIHTDAYGRVKVHFHWDRLGQKDGNDSCWMRVLSPWAGKSRAWIAIPRIGDEVAVDFLEGDPDRPIIVGSVPNAANMPPWGLPGAMTTAGLRTLTHKGAGYNELGIDDTAGKEKINIHAQYDMVTTVLHDDTQTVKNDRTITVEGKHTETITKDTSVVVKSGTFSHDVAANTATYHVAGDVTEKFDAKHGWTIGADQTIAVKAKRSTDITADDVLNVGANRNETVKGKRSADITGDETLTVNGKSTTTVNGGATITSPQKITLTVGPSTIELAPGGITLSCGPSTIKIDPSGVAITAPKISLNG